mmetsp:Transcript_896/g.1885  ORF Transcript_896/g.1885 Transcript_896/m.1885 type:complete len:193 (+) Transcript_896:163-741(+)|eukprot:CAMPEP_0197186256 /NCGR_PEP_ID=MMETSP1423-20130617/13550_1 /TAXON_ID=476441 /ORGANISM="Pseudo-nitzschia heimii, Strain UNC1101" /LENGTH=192 /DNA_ID=CAMNT_0042637515 /DNA_START=67 /DNA_END=645 /DNA_ORIENTATION=+
MSARSLRTGRSTYDEYSDDAEAYRRRNRQKDRRYRENNEEQEVTGRERGRQSNYDDERAVSDRQKRLVLDREQRMARLREEIKKEDETLAALDKQQSLEGRQTVTGMDQSGANKTAQEKIIEVHPEELEGLDEEEQMRKLLGIDGFGSTKGKAVEDNQSTAARGGAAKNKARKYRQYMNRKNGFNRPLEKMN